MSDAVIIEAAVNGATTKARNPHVPVTEDEIVADAQACLAAGAVIGHHHVALTRRSGDEVAEAYPAVWRRVLPGAAGRAPASSRCAAGTPSARASPCTSRLPPDGARRRPRLLG